MDWVKLLTEFDGNPKVLEVGLAGAGLYARALAYCGKYETDGFVPASWVRQAVACEGQFDLPEELVRVGYWELRQGGFYISGFDLLRGPRHRESISPALRRHVMERDGLICGICGASVELEEVHLDHRVPVALGGKTTAANLQVAHAYCNLKKGARLI